MTFARVALRIIGVLLYFHFIMAAHHSIYAASSNSFGLYGYVLRTDVTKSLPSHLQEAHDLLCVFNLGLFVFCLLILCDYSHNKCENWKYWFLSKKSCPIFCNITSCKPFKTPFVYYLLALSMVLNLPEVNFFIFFLSEFKLHIFFLFFLSKFKPGVRDLSSGGA